MYSLLAAALAITCSTSFRCNSLSGCRDFPNGYLYEYFVSGGTAFIPSTPTSGNIVIGIRYTPQFQIQALVRPPVKGLHIPLRVCYLLLHQTARIPTPLAPSQESSG